MGSTAWHTLGAVASFLYSTRTPQGHKSKSNQGLAENTRAWCAPNSSCLHQAFLRQHNKTLLSQASIASLPNALAALRFGVLDRMIHRNKLVMPFVKENVGGQHFFASVCNLSLRLLLNRSAGRASRPQLGRLHMFGLLGDPLLQVLLLATGHLAGQLRIDEVVDDQVEAILLEQWLGGVCRKVNVQIPAADDKLELVDGANRQDMSQGCLGQVGFGLRLRALCEGNRLGIEQLPQVDD